jgi:hypothetical protein
MMELRSDKETMKVNSDSRLSSTLYIGASVAKAAAYVGIGVITTPLLGYMAVRDYIDNNKIGLFSGRLNKFLGRLEGVFLD